MSSKAPSKPVIAVDLDNVLALSAQTFIDFCNSHFNAGITLHDYHEDWTKMWQVSEKEAMRRAEIMHREHMQTDYAPVPGAVEVLRTLKSNYKLIVTTARRKLVEDITRAWLDKYYPGIFEEIHFSGFWDGDDYANGHLKHKGDLYQVVGANFAIDDQFKHCLAAANDGIGALLFGDFPWNQPGELMGKVTGKPLVQLPAGIVRVKDWAAVADFFKRKGMALGVQHTSRHPGGLNADFKQRVLAVVAQIPQGRVMTYGQIASLCGNPRAARIVGGIAHWSDPDLPWQRVVKKNGGLAEGFPGGVQGHREALEAEGVVIGKDYRIDVERLLWRP